MAAGDGAGSAGPIWSILAADWLRSAGMAAMVAVGVGFKVRLLLVGRRREEDTSMSDKYDTNMFCYLNV